MADFPLHSKAQALKEYYTLNVHLTRKMLPLLLIHTVGVSYLRKLAVLNKSDFRHSDTDVSPLYW